MAKESTNYFKVNYLEEITRYMYSASHDEKISFAQFCYAKDWIQSIQKRLDAAFDYGEKTKCKLKDEIKHKYDHLFLILKQIDDKTGKSIYSWCDLIKKIERYEVWRADENRHIAELCVRCFKDAARSCSLNYV